MLQNCFHALYVFSQVECFLGEFEEKRKEIGGKQITEGQGPEGDQAMGGGGEPYRSGAWLIDPHRVLSDKFQK